MILFVPVFCSALNMHHCTSTWQKLYSHQTFC